LHHQQKSIVNPYAEEAKIDVVVSKLITGLNIRII